MTLPKHYPILISWSDEDNGFIATVPDLPGCCAFGETKEMAMIEAEFAIEAWIEAANELNRTIPEPSKPSTNW